MASTSEQCSVLVPSMARMWSPACRAPLLRDRDTEGLVQRTEPQVASALRTPASPHLSTTLAGLMRSMVITGLFRWEPVVREIPRADPGVLAISTTNGPEALVTVSGMMGGGGGEREESQKVNMLTVPPGRALMSYNPYCLGRGAMEGKRYTQPPAKQVRPPPYFRNMPHLHPKHLGLTSALPEMASHFL